MVILVDGCLYVHPASLHDPRHSMSRHAPVRPIFTAVYLSGGVADAIRSATRNAGYLDRAPDNAVLIVPGTRLKFLCPTGASAAPDDRAGSHGSRPPLLLPPLPDSSSGGVAPNSSCSYGTLTCSGIMVVSIIPRATWRLDSGSDPLRSTNVEKKWRASIKMRHSTVAAWRAVMPSNSCHFCPRTRVMARTSRKWLHLAPNILCRTKQ
jgi:hypothetical protein